MKKDEQPKDGEKDWRHVPPNSSKGETKEKTVNGKVYKWCGKCRNNKGLWTTGKYLHSTEEHKPKKKADDNPSPETPNGEAGNLGYVDEPLEFGFLCMETSSACQGCNKPH